MFIHLGMGNMGSLDMVMLIPGELVIEGCYCCTDA